MNKKTKNTGHKKRKNIRETLEKQEFINCKWKWRGIHCEEYRLCVTASNNILENAIQKEYMLCVTASFIVKKICCVLLPTSL